jgi:hypothetical protein
MHEEKFVNHALRAVDVRVAAAGISGSGTKTPIRAHDLPVAEQIVPDGGSRDQAVLSWRWDVDGVDGTSRNISAAVAHAADMGVRYLFMDMVSVDQSLSGRGLIESVATFTGLFEFMPVIAAYDTVAVAEDLRHYLRTLRRPWIAKELLAMGVNPQRIQYVGHRGDQGAGQDFGFQHMLKRVWTTTFANSILYVLTGVSDMHDVSDLALVMIEHQALLAVACKQVGREDLLMTAALASQFTTDDFRVNGDINIRGANFGVYRLVAAGSSPGFWENWDIVLDGEVVGRWSEKEHTMDGSSRRTLSRSDNAAKVFARLWGVDVVSGPRRREVSNDEADQRLSKVEIYNLCDRFGTVVT